MDRVNPARVAAGTVYIRSGIGEAVQRAAGVSDALVGAEIGMNGRTVKRWKQGLNAPRPAAAAAYADIVDALIKVVDPALLDRFKDDAPLTAA